MIDPNPEFASNGHVANKTANSEVVARVLCVDDEPYVLEGLRLNLERHYRVSTATSGAEALGILDREGPYAVVISDLGMPEMDGAAFLSQVRQRFPDTVRLLLTGHADVNSAVVAVNEGQIFRFLTKPCPPVALLSAVQAAHDQYRLVHSRLKILDQAKSDFLRMVSHEFRTPLNGVLGVSELILEGLPASSEAPELRDMFEQSRRRILTIMDDALLLGAC